MANKKIDKEKLSDEQLNAVVGGNLEEFNQLLSTVSANTHLQNKFKEQLEVVTRGNLDLEKTKDVLKSLLLNELGIETKIFFIDKNNTYKNNKTGAPLLHNDVITMIKNYR